MVERHRHPRNRLAAAGSLRLTPPVRTRALWIAGAVALAVAALALWPQAPSVADGSSPGVVSLEPDDRAAGNAALPAPTSAASVAATLRQMGSPPPPDRLRNNPQAQAAYDASAKPGDYVTPPNVSIEH
jgi:hypothetical protein